MNEKFYSIVGKVSKYMPPDFIEQVVKYCKSNDFDGYLHIGCPLGADADDEATFTADALLITKQCGVIVFAFPQDVANEQKIWDEQDAVYTQAENYFRNYRNTLIKNRRLIFDFAVVSVVPNELKNVPNEYNICIASEIANVFLSSKNPLDDEIYKKIRAALQKIVGLKTATENPNVSADDKFSFGGKMAHIGRAIKNMDEFQHRAANEFTKSALRIRGIAGSGKTIVLAGRAAYLHSQYPDWNIAVTFFSRALKQQLKDLIKTFYRTYNPYREPDWEKIHILHSWGAPSENVDGLYFLATKTLKAPFRTLNAAARLAVEKESTSPFDAACQELLTPEIADKCKPEYDAILIDEAQDMPASFFQLVYNLTKTNDEGKKCIIWAYDELQSLENMNMPDETELFGKDAAGNPRINLSDEEDAFKPREKISLSVCYRNPMWILVVAHALGFGIYRRPAEKESFGLIQMFDDLNAWENVGYECAEGTLDFGQKVILRRSSDATPTYFGQLLTAEESVQYKKFDTPDEQYSWVASEIEKNIREDKLRPEEILVVFLRTSTAWKESKKFKDILKKKGISSGYIGKEGEIGKDLFRMSGKVTLTQIYRAKGNEAPMVYVLDADYCAAGETELRNKLFTAITRSKAWVRITGVGNAMDAIIDEINACKENNYQLAFTIPSKAELDKIKKINQDTQNNIAQSKIKKSIEILSKNKNQLSKEDRDALASLSGD